MEESIKKQIEQDVSQHKIMLYMKGTPDAPRCGFSAKVVELLAQTGKPYESRDVLQNEGLRQGIKEFSDWPTVPQLYVNGKFIGGCDIVTEMAQNGELAKLLEPL